MPSPTNRTDYRPSVKQRFDIELLIVETAPYESLNIENAHYPHWVVSHVLSGDVVTATCGTVSHAGVGDVMIHPPNLPFSEAATRPGIHQWMLFDASISGIVELFRLYPAPPVVTLLDRGWFAETFRRLERSWGQSGLNREISCTGTLLELIGMVLDSWHAAGALPRPAAMSTSADRFAAVLAFMRANLADRITRNDLAAQAFLHPGYFDRVFRAAYGMPPMQMLREIRLARSAELIQASDEPLESVAQSCGFADAAHFSRLFVVRYGTSPGKYRESAKQTRQSYIEP